MPGLPSAVGVLEVGDEDIHLSRLQPESREPRARLGA